METYRGYNIKSIPTLIGYQIEYIGRGSNHLSLRGFFTDKRVAKKFIDSYLDEKEVADGKKLQRRRSK